ncbi:MAG: hypothetical protein K9G41_08730 [Flavobacteriales bacterium]|nr:hypothetical protein [Flavobacteriales bacterium]
MGNYKTIDGNKYDGEPLELAGKLTNGPMLQTNSSALRLESGPPQKQTKIDQLLDNCKSRIPFGWWLLCYENLSS